MKRIYFVAPDIDATKKFVNDLLLARVEERRIHVLAKRDTPLDDLPEATFLEKTDFFPAFGQGLAIGGVTGTVAGLVIMTWAGDFAVGSSLLVGTFFLGAGLGALGSSM